MPDSTDQRISSEEQSIDPRAIDAVLRIGGVALLAQLVDVAEDNIRQRLRQIETALAAEPPDTAAAERAAHSLKSSAAYLGAEALRRHAEQMELDAGRGRTDCLPARIAEARRLLELVLPVLAEELRGRQGGS